MAAKRPIGILAGAGRMPVIAAASLARAGRPVVAVQLAEAGQRGLTRRADIAATFSIGKAGAILAFFKEHGVKEILLTGKVDKQLNFADFDFDEVALAMLAKLPNRQDMSLFGVIADELKTHGMKIAKQTQVLADLVVPEGHLAGPAPDERIATDIALGFDVADTIAGFDIGQTVVVWNGTVIAVEAFEHTDACLRRAGKLAGKGAVVCKSPRPKQDPRFDVPTIGAQTITVMSRIGAVALAVQAGQTLIADPEKTFAAADERGICLVGVSRA